MRLAEQIGILRPPTEPTFSTSLLLKDAGCSSNSSKLFHILAADEIRAKCDVKFTDWTRVGWESLQYALTHVATSAPFLERVRTLVRRVAAKQQRNLRIAGQDSLRARSPRSRAAWAFRSRLAQAIQSLDEHWNGGGYPDGLMRRDIPLFSRIMNLSQTLDIFYTHRNAETAIDVVCRRSKRWFDPDLVNAAVSLAKSGGLWRDLEETSAIHHALALEPEDRRMLAGEQTIENICQAFAEIIDAKSPFTYRHSTGVAEAAVAISRQFSFNEQETTFMRRAALLHDIGKLSVPNTILRKPDPLDAAEWRHQPKQHPYYSYEILRKISGFEQLSEQSRRRITRNSTVPAISAITGRGAALASRRASWWSPIFSMRFHAKRPYRDAMPLEKVFGIIEKDAPRALDAQCVEALKAAESTLESTSASLLELSRNVGQSSTTTKQEENRESTTPVR